MDQSAMSGYGSTGADTSSHLGAEHRTFIKNVFKNYDKDQSDSIPAENFGDAIRMCGLNPTVEQLEKAKFTADEHETGVIKFEDFLKGLGDVLEVDATAEDLENAFRAFDPSGRLLIPAADLRYILTTYGLKLSDEEMNEFMLEAQSEMEGEFIKYDDLGTKFVADWFKV